MAKWQLPCLSNPQSAIRNPQWESLSGRARADYPAISARRPHTGFDGRSFDRSHRDGRAPAKKTVNIRSANQPKMNINFLAPPRRAPRRLAVRALLIAALLAGSFIHPAAAPAAQTPTQSQKQPAASPKAPPDPHAGHAAPPAGRKLSPAQQYFSDVELLNQDGEKLRFYSDVLKGKTVVVNAFFATCTGVCPPMNRNMKAIQEALGDRVGKDVFLVSITVDPTTDTPARLKEYAQKFQARPGWVFLTGKKENVDWALYKLGQYVEDKGEHKTIFIIGNEATGLWKKAFGLAKADELIKIVDGVMNDKGAVAK